MLEIEPVYKENITWTAQKILEYLRNEYPKGVTDFIEYSYIDNPTIIYKEFIIMVESENKVIIGYQPGMKEMDRKQLKKNIKMLVDYVLERDL